MGLPEPQSENANLLAVCPTHHPRILSGARLAPSLPLAFSPCLSLRVQPLSLRVVDSDGSTPLNLAIKAESLETVQVRVYAGCASYVPV